MGHTQLLERLSCELKMITHEPKQNNKWTRRKQGPFLY